MSDEFTIQKDEEERRLEQRAASKKRFDDIVKAHLAVKEMATHIDSGTDMALSAIFMLKGMLVSDTEEVCTNDALTDAVKRLLEASRDITDALLSERRKKEEKDDGETGDVLQ